MGADGPEELTRKLKKPRAVWLMLPAGDITEGTVRELGLLEGRTTSSSTAAIRSGRTTFAAPACSSNAACITSTSERANGDPRAEQGYIHAGPSGAGHFAKMVHNGIEYGLMQAYAEGFDILKNAGSEALPEAQRFDLNIADIAEVWRRGSVITSWLLDLTASALAEEAAFAAYSGFVQDLSEGRWTIHAVDRRGIQHLGDQHDVRQGSNRVGDAGERL